VCGQPPTSGLQYSAPTGQRTFELDSQIPCSDGSAAALPGNHHPCCALNIAGWTSSVRRALCLILPRNVSIQIQSLSEMPSFRAVSGFMSATGSGWSSMADGICRSSE